jgi:multidrug efflux pump subunit AcrB
MVRRQPRRGQPADALHRGRGPRHRIPHPQGILPRRRTQHRHDHRPYRGATPAEVEEGVIIKIEEAIQDIEGIDRVTAEAREGEGEVIVEVEQGWDVSEVTDELKMRVDGISTFPLETERPIIVENRVRNEVIRIQLSGDVSERMLKQYAERVRDEVTLLPGVTQAVVSGARAYEISIEVSEERMREYGLTFDDVVRAVQSSSLDLPAGSIRTPGGDYLLRTKGQAYTGPEFEGLILMTRPDGTRILLGDVARVVDGFEDADVLARYNGKPSVSVRVDRTGDQSTLAVAEAIRKYVDEKQAALPPGIEMIFWRDRSVPLMDRLDLMLRNAGQGGVLVFLALALFLRLKLAFWVIIGIPVSFLGRSRSCRRWTCRST